jgi:TolB-like protein
VKFLPFTLVGLLLLAGCAEHYVPYRFTNYTTDHGALDNMLQKRVAVLPFDNALGGYTEASAIADEFSLQLGKIGRFDIVERERVTELFKEQDFDPKRLDAKTAVAIGKMLGAHGVVMGNVTEYRAGRVGLQVKLVGVETGEIAWQASDILSARDGRVLALVTEPLDRERLKSQPEYLGQVLCRLMAETLK